LRIINIPNAIFLLTSRSFISEIAIRNLRSEPQCQSTQMKKAGNKPKQRKLRSELHRRKLQNGQRAQVAEKVLEDFSNLPKRSEEFILPNTEEEVLAWLDDVLTTLPEPIPISEVLSWVRTCRLANSYRSLDHTVQILPIARLRVLGLLCMKLLLGRTILEVDWLQPSRLLQVLRGVAKMPCPGRDYSWLKIIQTNKQTINLIQSAFGDTLVCTNVSPGCLSFFVWI